MIVPFNLINASATFQSYINKTLYEYLDIFIIIYLDDIMIYFSYKKDHKKYIHKVLKILINADLYIKLFKCHFSTHKIDFLNYQVFTEEIFIKSL